MDGRKWRWPVRIAIVGIGAGLVVQIVRLGLLSSNQTTLSNITYLGISFILVCALVLYFVFARRRTRRFLQMLDELVLPDDYEVIVPAWIRAPSWPQWHSRVELPEAVDQMVVLVATPGSLRVFDSTNAEHSFDWGDVVAIDIESVPRPRVTAIPLETLVIEFRSWSPAITFVPACRRGKGLGPLRGEPLRETVRELRDARA